MKKISIRDNKTKNTEESQQVAFRLACRYVQALLEEANARKVTLSAYIRELVINHVDSNK